MEEMEKPLRSRYETMVKNIGLDAAKDIANKVQNPEKLEKFLQDRRQVVRKYAECFAKYNGQEGQQAKHRISSPIQGKGLPGKKWWRRWCWWRRRSVGDVKGHKQDFRGTGVASK